MVKLCSPVHADPFRAVYNMKNYFECTFIECTSEKRGELENSPKISQFRTVNSLFPHRSSMDNNRLKWKNFV